MQGAIPVRVVALLLTLAVAVSVSARETAIGSSVDSLLDVAREANPEYIGMRLEADAAAERVLRARERL